MTKSYLHHLLMTLTLLLLGCGAGGGGAGGGGADGDDSATSPDTESFEINLAVELAHLSLQTYQQLDDYTNNRTFSLPASYVLQEQFFTTERFTGESLSSGEEIPIAFVATAQDRIYVAFRGTQTISEWINNIRFKQVDYIFVADGGQTHQGFTEIYRTIREPIVETIKNLLVSGSYSRLYITGHSLGGALAVLAAPELRERTTMEPAMYNFGGPRVGDPDFQQRYGELVTHSWRTVNTNDPVPALPPETVWIPVEGSDLQRLSYTHVSTENEITFGSPIEGPSDIGIISANHSMCNYYQLLCDSTADPAACKTLTDDIDSCSP
ncbi:MAG: lipase family protein [Gammaproteobacteria bacterium]|nr:lipase family protein [Gammaproteobacteria bacterium]